MGTEEKIEIAIKKMVNSWDKETLIQYVIDERLDYYLSNKVCKEEIEVLLQEWC